MRLVRLYITLVLVTLATCEEPATTTNVTTRTPEEESEIENVREKIKQNEELDTLKISAFDSLDSNTDQLPILPPIILLDFANDVDNSSSSNDEKSKRTIDGNLGYGFGRNNLFTGKYNYYFPAGKSGTTVSIEESISPFLPKTIVETVKPITEKSHPRETNHGYGQNPLLKSKYQTGLQGSGQTVQPPTNRYLGLQTVYGQRTKLYKPSQIDYSSFQSFGSTPQSTVESYTTPRSDYRVNSQVGTQNGYVTPKPSFEPIAHTSEFSQGFQTSQRPFASFSTPAPPSYVTPTSASYQTRYTINPGNGYSTPRTPFGEATTLRSTANQVYSSESPLAPYANLPRYTIENGVRYENKILWKYPDGKIAQTPPPLYLNAYNEFISKQKSGADLPISYQNVGTENYESPGVLHHQSGVSNPTASRNSNYQSPLIRHHVPQQQTRYPAESFSNIYSKSPAQFPLDPEASRSSRPSPFVSSASLASINHGAGSRVPQSPQGLSYEQAFQGQYGQKTPLRGTSSIHSSRYPTSINNNAETPKDSYGSAVYEEQRPISKYAVNSPDPEYTYSTDSPLKSTTPASSTSLFTPSGELTPKVLSKYSPQAQKYLTKVFNADASPTSPSAPEERYTPPTSSYLGRDYEKLFNYNPSISQYIRNPSSILNAQPTYIQAGNSLIPVIILRVDGAPPIQPKVTPNINLKALLQQYLSQYAGNIGQDANYDNINYREPSGIPLGENAPQNPLYELTELAKRLTQYSRNPLIANQFANQFEGDLNHNPYETSNSYDPKTNYATVLKHGKSDINNYDTKTNKQKVKSVQIIEDPRFTSYKVNS